MKRSLQAFVLVLFASAAMAGTITSIDPATIKVNSGEWFLTIYGSGLGNIVVFDGPAGHFERNTNANFTGWVATWVPESIVRTSGNYSVYVKGGTGDSNVVNFQVQGFKFFPFVIIAPDFWKVQAISRDGATVKYDVFWAGGESGDGSVDCFPRSGDFFKFGTTMVNCTGSNSAGEKAETSFPVIVADEIAPQVTVPREPIVVKWESREGAKVTFDAKAYDDIYGDIIPDCLPRSGSIFPVGITNVVCSATDPDLNIGFGTFVVEVQGDLKPYPLTVKVPRDFSVDARSPEGEVVEYKVTVSGTDDPSPEVTCNLKSETVFPLGTNNVVCDAIDRWGMRGQGSFYVEVRDPEAPIIDKLYATPDKLANDGRVIPVEIIAGAFDNFDPRPLCTVFAVTSNQGIDLGDFDDPKDYDWTITGDLKVELRGEASRVDRYYDVWVGCTDYYGNRTNSTARVWVPVSGGQSEPAPSTPTKRRSGGKG